ncbi:MAG: tetratricopeptide repeat protein [Deltaproteobacteria bacterium]|nr:tetratricopeptide repeat protein [Deltaproteobacteria bacterium]
MDRPRIRVRRSRKSVPPESRSDAPPPYEDREASGGFALAFSGGRGIIAMDDEPLSDAATVDRLELFISDLAFPFDVTAGVKGLRHRRHTLGRLKITVTLDGLVDMVERRLVNSSWCGVPRFSFEKDHVSILLDYGPDGSRVPVTFRLVPVIKDDSLELLLDQPRAYGPLPANPLLVAAASMQEMTGTRPIGLHVPLLNPIKYSLLQLLPKRGWRLPDYSEVRLFRLELLPDRAVFDYRHLSLMDGTVSNPFSGDDSGEIERLRKIEENRTVRDSDVLLVNGQVAEARAMYAKLLDRDPSNPVIAARLAMVDITNSDLRETARALVADMQSSHAKRSDLAGVLAHGAALAGDEQGEEGALSTLAQRGNSLERLAAGLRRGRLLLNIEPTRAAEALQGALAARREDHGALSASLDALAAAGNIDQVKALIPRWIAAHKHAAERSAAYVKVGDLLLRELDDPPGAAKHFERAALSDPGNIDAAWGLAESLARAGEAQRAISQFERLERICKEASDNAGAARALAEIGGIWISRNEPSLAIQRFREALDMAPDLSRERVRMASVLVQMSRHAEAAGELETALKKAGSDHSSTWWGKAALNLSRLYLEELDDPAACEPWARAAATFPEMEAEARKYLLEALETGGRLEELEQELERSPSVASAIRIAEARRGRGDSQGARITIEHAVERFPESAELLDAYVEICREGGEKKKLRDALVRRVESVVRADRRATLEFEIGQLELNDLADPRAAASWFKQALEDDPSSIKAQDSLDAALDILRVEALRLQKDGAFTEARNLFATIQLDNEGTSLYPAALGEAETAFELGDYEGALRAAMVAGDGPVALKARAAKIAAMSLVKLDGPDEAIRHLEQASRNLSPAEASSLLFLAAKICADSLGDLARAKALFESVIACDPLHDGADKALLEQLEKTGDHHGLVERLLALSGEEGGQERMRRAAEILFADGDPSWAARILNDLYSISDELRDARMLARALKETGDVDALLGLVRARSKKDNGIDEQLLEELEMLADLLESREETEAAFKVTEELARYSDPDGVRCARAARLAQANSDMKQARRLWTEAVDRTPDPSWILRLIKFLDPDEDKEELAGLFERLDGIQDSLDQPGRLQLLDVQVNRHLVAGQQDEAAELLSKMMELSPENDAVWERLTTVLERRGRWMELVEQMRKRETLLENPVDIADIKTALGRILEEKLGDELAAQTAYDEALKMVPDHQVALKARACLAYQRQKWSRLEQLLERMSPEIINTEIELWRAATAEHLGRADEAVAVYQRLISADPSNTSAIQGLARLEPDVKLEDKLSNAFEKLRGK